MELIEYVLMLLGIGTYVAWFVAIASKAGFSGWWGALWGGLALIPGVNVLAALAIVLIEWPVERELKELRRTMETSASRVADPGTKPPDVQGLEAAARRFEQAGQSGEAIAIYEVIVESFPDSPESERAAASLQHLRERTRH